MSVPTLPGLTSAEAGPATFDTATLDNGALDNATRALKALAAHPDYRAAFVRTPALSELFAAPAGRYVLGRDRPTLWSKLELLSGKGYRTGIEYVGEEVSDPEEIEAICQEYLALVAEADAGAAGSSPGRCPVQLGFDLSNVGLLVSRDLALANTARILRAAAEKNITVVISMERSGFVDAIIDVFGELAPVHPNIGLTLQAHLHRTVSDVATVAGLGRKIRLVKGVYREAPDVALPRGAELNERYADLAAALLDRAVPLACGTHDMAVLDLLDQRGLTGSLVELEMLHGVRPALLRGRRMRGVPCRVSCVYGENWWLHFLHRLAEYPPNVLTALADLADPNRIRFGVDY